MRRARVVLVVCLGGALATAGCLDVLRELAAGEDRARPVLEMGDRVRYLLGAYNVSGVLMDGVDVEAVDAPSWDWDHPDSVEMRILEDATLSPYDVPADVLVGARPGDVVRHTVFAAHWEPFFSEPLPRDVLPSRFARTVFLQEPDQATAEGNEPARGFDLERLEEEVGPLAPGQVFLPPRTFPPSWPVVFDDVNFENRSVTFHHTVAHGQHFEVPGLPGGVTVLLPENETQIAYRLGLQAGDAFAVAPESDLARSGLSVGSYRVAQADGEHIWLEYRVEPLSRDVATVAVLVLAHLGPIPGSG